MNKPLLLDTDVFVDFLRGHPAAVAYVTARVNRIVLCPLVAAELYAGVRDDEELERLDEFLSLFPVADLTRDIAQRTACTSGISSVSRNWVGGCRRRRHGGAVGG